MNAAWALVVIAISLAGCGGLNKYNSVCYMFVYNAVAVCIPEDEIRMQPPPVPPANKEK